MKLVLVAVFCGLFAYAASEFCGSVGDCSHVTCDSGHDLDCHTRQCTCTANSQPACQASNDCSGNCRHNDWHCVDNKCRCGFGIGGVGK